MKRLLAAALAAGSLLCQVPTAQAVGTSASSAILMEAESGRVLYEQNAHEERLIASITKLMTALVALESGHDLEETVTVGGGLHPGRGFLPLSAPRGGNLAEGAALRGDAALRERRSAGSGGALRGQRGGVRWADE